MTVGDYRLRRAINDFSNTKEDTANVLSGILGLTSDKVQVPNREGFVYVRLRDNLSEVLEAYNDAVSPVYNLPVLIKWDKTRYIIIGRDLERYVNWGTTSAYLPSHGNSHSFGESGGGDVVWVFSRQVMPWLISPSGSSAAGSALVNGYPYYFDDQWKYLGTSGTPVLTGNLPTGGNSARMSLVYLNPDTNILGVANNTEEFSALLTGTADVIPHIPQLPASWYIPLAGVRLVTGTTTIGWNNLYDVRPFFSSVPTGTSGGASVAGFSDGSVLFAENEQIQEDNPNFFYDNPGNTLVLRGTGTAHIQGATTAFSIQGNGASVGMEIRTAGVTVPFFAMGRANGTFESPIALNNGDIMYRNYSYGYDGNDYVNKARVDHIATENWNTSSRGTKMQIRTTPTGTANTEAVGEWVGTGLDLIKGVQFNHVEVSGASSYSMDGEDTFVWAGDNGGAAVTINLPPVSNDGQLVVVKAIYDPITDGGALTVAATGEDSIEEGDSSVTIDALGDCIGLIADASETRWRIIFWHKTTANIVTTKRVTNTYTILTTDQTVYCDTDGGDFTVTLPAGYNGLTFRIINCGSSANTLTVDGDGTENVRGAATQELADGEILILTYETTEEWW
jgi:hypothetical protein